MFRHVASMIFVWTMQPLDAGWKPLARLQGGQKPRSLRNYHIATPLTIVQKNDVWRESYYDYSANQFFFPVLPFRIRSQTIMWPASKITMTPPDTINAGCSGPGWREAIWWRPLVMSPVKSHSWSLVFWSWKLRPLLCASAMFKLIHHGSATRLFRRGPMKMKDFKWLQDASKVFFFVEGSWRNPAWFWKKQRPNFTHLFSWLEWWGPRHVQPHRRIAASADATPTPWWLAWNCDLVPLKS